MSNFSATVTEWARQSEARLKATRNRAIELLADDMTKTKGQGGRVPFDTGNLARSLLASTSGMPKTSETPTAGVNVGVIAATLKLDEPVWLGYQAIYSRVANYGFVGADKLGRVHNREGNYFVEGAIAQWPQFVDQAARELQSSVEGG